MLVLSRKEKQEIQIGNDVTIRILSVKGNVVRIGFEAPKEIDIVRSELLIDAGCDNELHAVPAPISIRSGAQFSSQKLTGQNSSRTGNLNSKLKGTRLKENSGKSEVVTLPLASLLPGR